MKKTLIILLISFPVVLFAQNVGIGTTAPTGKLQINHRSSFAPGIKLVDSTTNIGGIIEFQNVNFTRGMKVSGFSSTNFNNGQYLDIRSDSVTAMTVRGNGFIGIRDLNPSYPLDVNGDINTTGSVRINGNAGTDGQVLQSNGNGTMSWADMSEYKNFEAFRATGPGSWTVPAGVTKIMVEIWGAGGGGNTFAGGGGGGYVCSYFTVVPGNTINFSIGAGGAGGGDNGINGLSTTLTVTGVVTLTASGGFGTTYSNVTKNIGGRAGGSYFSSTPAFRNYFGISGKPGLIGINTVIQSGASTFIESSSGADGGDGANSVNTGGKGGYFLYNLTTATIIKFGSSPAANEPAGGGSGGFSLMNLAAFSNGGSGADGLVIIHY
jgi:hypothetical protein